MDVCVNLPSCISQPTNEATRRSSEEAHFKCYLTGHDDKTLQLPICQETWWQVSIQRCMQEQECCLQGDRFRLSSLTSLPMRYYIND